MSDIHLILRDPRFVEAGIAEHCEYDSRAVIIEKGAEDRGLFVIESGSVRVLERIELDGSRHIQPGICDLHAGDVELASPGELDEELGAVGVGGGDRVAIGPDEMVHRVDVATFRSADDVGDRSGITVCIRVDDKLRQSRRS